MERARQTWGVVCLFLVVLIVLPFSSQTVQGQSPPASSGDSSIFKAVGSIKSVQPDSIIVSAEAGGEVKAVLTPSTKILRVPPGEKDLKNATVLQPQDLQPGDRVLVRGQASIDSHTITTLSVIVMKQSDVSAKHQRERDDWQKRGVGGLVSKVDSVAGTVTISSGGFGVKRDIIIHISKDTTLRRYAPGSVNFDDARPAPLAQIRVGDQLRARGTRSPDGNELAAEEAVSGSFRNIAGTITAVDVVSNTITVKDLIAKSTVVVATTSGSQIKKLPSEIAQRIAMRLKAAANADQAQVNGQSTSPQNVSGQASSPPGSASRPSPDSQTSHAPGGAGSPQGGSNPPDLQRFLGRLPSSKLADLQKGDAVMIVSTEGGDAGTVTAITLLAGVEPILTAAPNRSAYSLLSPWSLSASGGEGESAP